MINFYANSARLNCIAKSVLLPGLLILVFALQGCFTVTADFYERRPEVDSMAINGIVVFYEPVYNKRVSKVGAASALVLGIGAGWIGVKNPFIKDEDGKLSPLQSGLALSVLGGAIVYGVLKTGENTTNVDDSQRPHWLEMLNSQLASIGDSAINTYKFISRKHYGDRVDEEPTDYPRWREKPQASSIYSIVALSEKFDERNTVIENIEDAEFYILAFPNREHTAHILTNSVSKIKRDDLPKIIYILGGGDETLPAKVHYLETANSFDEIIGAYGKYPELGAVAEAKAEKSAASKDDFIKYLQAFPNGAGAKKISEYLKRIIENE